MTQFKSILVVLTEDSLHGAALDRAVRLARAHGASLTLVDAIGVEPGEIDRMLSTVSGARGPQIEEDLVAYHRARISEMAATARASGVDVSEAVLQGVPFVEIIRMVLREGHDLVVKGASTAKGGRGVLRGGDMHLLRKCPCAVWMVADPPNAGAPVVLAAIDPGAEDDALRAGLDRAVLDAAQTVAEADGAPLHIAHAWHFEPEQALRHAPGKTVDVDALLTTAEVAAAARLKAAGETVPGATLHLLKGDAGEEIATLAGTLGISTLVMGTVGRVSLPGFIMGNTAETILTQLTASVLALKPEGFVSPVKLDGA